MGTHNLRTRPNRYNTQLIRRYSSFISRPARVSAHTSSIRDHVSFCPADLQLFRRVGLRAPIPVEFAATCGDRQWASIPFLSRRRGLRNGTCLALRSKIYGTCFALCRGRLLSPVIGLSDVVDDASVTGWDDNSRAL